MEETQTDAAGGPSSALLRWFLLTGNRLLVSLVMLVVLGAVFCVLGLLEIATVTKASRVMWYLNGTVNGLLTLIPITVGVNQIVLSHEFGPIEDLYDRRTSITDFRERVEERTDVAVSSPYSSSFFGTLVSAIADAGRSIQRGGSRPADDRATDEFETTIRSVVEEAERVNERLQSEGTSMLETFLVMLGYDNTRQFHEIRRFQKEQFDDESKTADELGRINELITELDAARQFLKTVVVERQLARLSRLLIYTGVPAVTVAVAGIFVYRDVPWLTVPRTLQVFIAATIILVTLAPLAILGAYILRVATIAHRTAAYGPFIPEEGDDSFYSDEQ